MVCLIRSVGALLNANRVYFRKRGRSTAGELPESNPSFTRA